MLNMPILGGHLRLIYIFIQYCSLFRWVWECLYCQVTIESQWVCLLLTGSIDLTGLGDIKWDELFSLPKHYWLDDMRESKRFLEDQVGTDVPQVIWDELNAQEKRIEEQL